MERKYTSLIIHIVYFCFTDSDHYTGSSPPLCGISGGGATSQGPQSGIPVRRGVHYGEPDTVYTFCLLQVEAAWNWYVDIIQCTVLHNKGNTRQNTKLEAVVS